MAIIAILLIALGCLIAGLVMQSSAWLVASLIATSVAGYTLHQRRNVIATPKRVPPTDSPPKNGARAAVVSRGASDQEAAPKADDPAHTEDDEPPFEEDDEVWVIDGRPRYHLGDCAIIKGQDAEPISYEQATEDGFMPCSLCEPHVLPSRRDVPRSRSQPEVQA